MRCGALVLCLGLLWAPVRASTPNSDPLVQKAADLVEWGRLKEARQFLASASAQAANQHNPELLAYYAHVLVLFGESKLARAEAEKSVALDANCAACHLYLFEALADHAKKIPQWRALLELHKLRKQLETATALNPHLGDVQWGWIELDLSLPASVGGSTNDALQHAGKLAQTDPVDGHLARASIYRAMKKPEQALTEYRAAATEFPQDPRGSFALGKALYERAEYGTAAPYLARAWELNHQSALYAAYLAANLVRLKTLPEARQVLAAAASLHPDSRLGAYLAAQALKATGQDFNWAKQLLESYLTVPPEPTQPTLSDARQLLADLG
ncbi:MAG: hypothetical protein ACRD01_16825 [Terriglobales bacterium]